MKVMKSNPGWSLAVPLLLAAIALHGCQSTGKEKGGSENHAAQSPAAKQGAGEAPAISQGKTSHPDTASTVPLIPEQSFDVDPALLGLSYDDAALGIRFSPPRSWPPIEPELLEQTKQAYEKITEVQQDDQFVSKPVRIFCNKDKRYYMLLSNFTAWPAPVDPITKMDEYRERVATQNPGTIIQYGMSRHGKLVLYQLLTRSEIMADLRVIVIREGHVPVQIDFLVPQQVYPSIAKTVEASVGSIQPL